MNAFLFLILPSLPVPSFADDWPQIPGPDRNGIARGEKLLLEWPAGGPKAYTEFASNRVFGSTTFALPALSDGRLFVRDTRTLKCLAVSKTNR